MDRDYDAEIYQQERETFYAECNYAPSEGFRICE